MFKNEVLIVPEDKKRLVELLTEAKKILDKYPFSSDIPAHTVTAMCRAKNAVKNAKEWASLLYTSDCK